MGAIAAAKEKASRIAKTVEKSLGSIKSKIAPMKELHPDWTQKPTSSGFKVLPHKDRSHAYIIGTARDGKRYCRTVEVPNDMITTGAAQAKLERVFQQVIKRGPSVCCPVNGGEYPLESEQPPLDE